MRLLGLVFALGIIGWVMLQMAGGPEADNVISQGHQDALQKAEDVEATVHDALNEQMKGLDKIE